MGAKSNTLIEYRTIGVFQIYLWDWRDTALEKTKGKWNVDILFTHKKTRFFDEYYETEKEARHVYNNPEPHIFLWLATRD